jgi:hypothetical protein
MGTAATPIGSAPLSAASSAPLTPPLAWLVQRAGIEDAPPGASTAGDPGAYAQTLIAAGRAAEAIRLVACALTPREGVWWAWVSARHATQMSASSGKPVPPAAHAALDAVERWINQPTDEMRRAAWTAGQAAGLESPAGSAAAAAYFSAGSVAPADAPLVPPPPGLHSFMIGAAVTLAAASNPEHLDALARAFLAQAVEIVKQLGGWDRATAASRDYYEAQRVQHEHASAPPASPDTAAHG